VGAAAAAFNALEDARLLSLTAPEAPERGMVRIPSHIAMSVGEVLDLLDPDDMPDHVVQAIERFQAAIDAAAGSDPA
jgi:hypothetical protein